MLPADTGDSGGSLGGFQPVGIVNTFRVNQDNTTTPLVELTARSLLYDVVYTWAVTKATYTADGPDVLMSQKTAEVEAICAHDHVVGFRTEKEENRSGLLYNYAVITVGTDDGALTNTVSVRMDQVNTPGAFAAVDAAWNQIAKVVA